MKINRAQSNGIFAVTMMLPAEAEIELLQTEDLGTIQMIGRMDLKNAGKVFSIYKDGSYKLISGAPSIGPDVELGDPDETDL